MPPSFPASTVCFLYSILNAAAKIILLKYKDKPFFNVSQLFSSSLKVKPKFSHHLLGIIQFAISSVPFSSTHPLSVTLSFCIIAFLVFSVIYQVYFCLMLFAFAFVSAGNALSWKSTWFYTLVFFFFFRSSLKCHILEDSFPGDSK